jgi:probable rRNA maturation factor
MIRVAVANAHPTRRVARAGVQRAVRMVLEGEGISDAAISVVAVDSPRCRRLNRKFLRHDRVTDVISFPLESDPRLEGEVYVNLDTARRQAREYGVTPANEVMRLVVHGTLHLVGYDDRRPKDSTRMHRAQERYVERLALAPGRTKAG